MSRINQLLILISLCCLTSCDQDPPSFEEQIIQEVQANAAAGICDQIPKGSSIGEVHIGSIGPLEKTEFTLVKVDFDVTKGELIQHIFQKLVYSTEGELHILESMAGCRYVKPDQPNN
ncbi:MAG: hypothetical protein K9I85_10475 [Saprospiraceae bacterium]|nr:hypothetical protein [Saprospiraceae bacterium]